MRILVCPDCRRYELKIAGGPVLRRIDRRCPACRHRKRFPANPPRPYYPPREEGS